MPAPQPMEKSVIMWTFTKRMALFLSVSSVILRIRMMHMGQYEEAVQYASNMKKKRVAKYIIYGIIVGEKHIILKGVLSCSGILNCTKMKMGNRR